MSALAAVAVVVALVEWSSGGAPVAGTVSWGAVALLVVLWIPAGAAALLAWTVADLARLPGQIREAAREAGGRAREVGAGRSRIGGSLRALWSARGLALASRGAWLRAAGAVRFVRLASLPFALALLGLFALNAVVIGAGAVALVLLLLG